MIYRQTITSIEMIPFKNMSYIYRNDTIQEYEKDISDGVYHLYVLNADNSITEEYTTDSYSQNVDDLYPQLDRDNIQDNPQQLLKLLLEDHPLAV